MSLVASWIWEFELASEVAIVDSAVAVAAVEKTVCRETVVVGRKERESSMGEVKKISRGVRRERLGSFRRVS